MKRFHLKTIQASSIRTLFEVVKEILIDINLCIDTNGIHLTEMDGNHVALVNLKLDAKNFDEYTCNGPLKIGINVQSLFKLLKIITNQDTLCFYIDEDKKPNEVKDNSSGEEKDSLLKNKK